HPATVPRGTCPRAPGRPPRSFTEMTHALSIQRPSCYTVASSTPAHVGAFPFQPEGAGRICRLRGRVPHRPKGITVKTSKSLVLAPAVAVAVSGLIAVPAFASAASTPSESSDSIELPTDLPKAGPATVQPPQSPDGSAGATESSDATESPSASASESPEAGTPEAILETDQVSQADIADKN